MEELKEKKHMNKSNLITHRAASQETIQKEMRKRRMAGTVDAVRSG